MGFVHMLAHKSSRTVILVLLVGRAVIHERGGRGGHGLCASMHVSKAHVFEWAGGYSEGLRGEKRKDVRKSCARVSV